jgi:ankyrin repeat protein
MSILPESLSQHPEIITTSQESHAEGNTTSHIQSSTDFSKYLHSKRESTTEIEALSETLGARRSKQKLSEKESVLKLFKDWISPIVKNLPKNVALQTSSIISHIELSLELLEKPTYYSLKELSISHIQLDKLRKLLEETDKEKLLEKISNLERELQNNPCLSSIIQKIKDILYVFYANTYAETLFDDSKKNLEKVMFFLKSIKNIDLRMSVMQFYELDLFKEPCNILSIHQRLVIDKFQSYLKKRNPKSNTPNIEGLCHGLTLLYGYYEFLGKKDEFFARLEKLLDNSIINIDSMDSAKLEQKTYSDLTEEEKECEDLCNDVLYLQASYYRGIQKEFCSSVQFISEKREILSLRSRLQYANFFEYDEEQYTYTNLTKTIENIVNVDKQPKFLQLSTGTHSIGIFYRNKKCFLYDPNDDLPSLAYDSKDTYDMSCLTDKLTDLLDLQIQPLSLSINLVTNEPIQEIDKLKSTLYGQTVTGCDAKPSYNKLGPLHLACLENYLESVNLLLEKGSPLNLQDDYLKTPLHLASQLGFIESTTALLEKGASVTVKDSYLETPLHLACYNDNLEIINLLLKAGAEINIQNSHGSTPLHNACRCGLFKLVVALLENGANVDIQDLEGKTPLQLAQQEDYEEIVNAFKLHPLK